MSSDLQSGSGQPTNGATRLMITKMVLENFKSYAGVQEIGPFHKSFSSIVGPNGSGKSNVIDALLFVFGKRAKQLRLNKVSELIHKSSNFQSLEYARVSVHFQMIEDIEESEDDFVVIPGSEFVVTRIAYTNNTSKYIVDGKNSTYNDVGQLLRGYGIDLDNNRFLILQGEVEQIAMMKPKGQTPHEDGLLEYLEDIIGSNRFVEPIAEAEKELDQINEIRTEKINRLKIAERERDNLSGSKLEAEAFMEKEKNIRRNNNTLFQVYETKAEANVKKHADKLSHSQEKLATQRAKLAEREMTYKDMETNYDNTHSQYTKIEKELQQATSEFGAFERRDVKIQEDMKHAKSQIKKLQAAIAKDSKKEEECIKDADKAQKEAELHRTGLEEVATKKQIEEQVVEEIVAGMQEATQELRAQLETAQISLADAERGVAGLQTEKETICTSIQLVNSRKDSAIKNLALTEEKVSKCVNERAELQNKVAEAMRIKKAAEATSQKLQSRIKTLQQQELQIQSSIRQGIADVEEAKSVFAAQSSSGKANSVVTAILKASKKGAALAHAGVRGRLGDLGTISAEYDVAISTACGALDCIVVDTTEGGQACVQYLKDNQLGRATFVILDKMDDARARMDRPFETPAGVQRLFDLITPAHDDFRPALYYATSNTLVAPNLDTAMQVGYSGRVNANIVTLTGEMIERSGAMSGGGNQVRSGGMKLSSRSPAAATSISHSEASEVTQAQIDALEAQVVALQTQLSGCREEMSQCEADYNTAISQAKAAVTELSKSEAAAKLLAEQEKDLNDAIITLRGTLDLSTDERRQLGELQARLEAVEAEMLRVSPQLGQCKSAVASIQRRIMDVGGPKLAKAQAKLDILTKQFDALSSQLNSKEIDEATNRKQAAKAAAAREKGEQEIQKLNDKLKELTVEQQEMENDALAVIKAVDSAKQRMAQQEELLKRITEEFQELKAAVASIKSAELDLTVEIEHVQKDLKEATKQADHWKKELTALRNLHIEEQKEFFAAVDAIVKADASATSASVKSLSSSSSAVIDTSNVEALPVLPVEQLEVYASDASYVEDLKQTIATLEMEKERLKGNVNMNALMEYLRKDAHYRSRLADLESTTEARNVLRSKYEGLRRQRLEEFMAGFGVIALKLKEMYQMITLGGDAELELVDSLDPFSEGIVFSVRPPKKSWKNISNLSGGEKTLSSLALVFALHHYKPTPLYVMDEIDAALDFKNVSIVANYIKDRTKNAQFVIISLRNNMFELADRLVGIYKTNDATKSVTINPRMFVSVAQVSQAARTTANAIAGPSATSKVVENAEDERASKVKRVGGVLSDATNM